MNPSDCPFCHDRGYEWTNPDDISVFLGPFEPGRSCWRCRHGEKRNRSEDGTRQCECETEKLLDAIATTSAPMKPDFRTIPLCRRCGGKGKF